VGIFARNRRDRGLIEVISGQSFDRFIKARILDPLGMVDTGFVVPEKDQSRLVAYYAGADIMDPMKPGLTRIDNAPYPGAYLRPTARLNGGGGLVSTMPDMVALIRSLLPGGPTLLKPETIALMMSNQLPEGQWIRFVNLGEMPGQAFGLAGGLIVKPSPLIHPDATGEFYWAALRAVVDFADAKHGWCHDGAAPDGFHPPVLVRVQAAGL
jgi:CubicO group peptidase (beta-lactamase class C family)